jgi:hypothetical protein
MLSKALTCNYERRIMNKEEIVTSIVTAMIDNGLIDSCAGNDDLERNSNTAGSVASVFNCLYKEILIPTDTL